MQLGDILMNPTLQFQWEFRGSLSLNFKFKKKFWHNLVHNDTHDTCDKVQIKSNSAIKGQTEQWKLCGSPFYCRVNTYNDSIKHIIVLVYTVRWTSGISEEVYDMGSYCTRRQPSVIRAHIVHFFTYLTSPRAVYSLYHDNYSTPLLVA